jgi:hypothetical protein
MENRKDSKLIGTVLLYLVIVAAAAATRLVPHEWNMAPVSAVAIFAAMYLPLRHAIALPLAARFVSDLVIGFFNPVQMIAVYGAHLFGVVLGRWIRQRKSVGRVAAAPVLAGIVFFLVTNFAFLYPEYPHNVAGIIAAYVNGLPFLRGTLLGDMLYTYVLVGGYEAVAYLLRRQALQRVRA